MAFLGAAPLFTVWLFLIISNQKGHGEKRCEIQGGGQEMAVMVG